MSQTETRNETSRERPSTVDRILDAAGAILDADGLPGFNTNAIAKRAGVNVATLYHHFADKNDVLLRLAERIEGGRVRFFEHVSGRPDLFTDWERLVPVVLTELHRLRREAPGAIGIRRALAAVPEAQARFDEYTQLATDDLVTMLLTAGPIEPRVARAAATTVVEVTGSLLDLAAFGSSDPEAVLDEGVRLLVAYFRALFAGVAPSG